MGGKGFLLWSQFLGYVALTSLVMWIPGLGQHPFPRFLLGPHFPVPGMLMATLGTLYKVTGPGRADQSPRAQISAERREGEA